MLIEKKYLIIPVSPSAQPKQMLFWEDGQLVYDLSINLDAVDPEHLYYLDVSRFGGREIEISFEPAIDFMPEQLDQPDQAGLYQEKYRPAAHFSTARGWLNDPNGLYRSAGRYHMFYQHNPVGSNWSCMHWGHASSHDLLHWQEEDIVLFPDEMGTMYSGSAFIDKHNVTSLKNGPADPVLLFYTAAGSTSRLSEGKKFSQCLAYSTDGGKSFQKYQQNPLIEHKEAKNRDPKVVFCPELAKYYLVLYLTESRFAFYASDNLLDWQFINQLALPGDRECPDFVQLGLSGTMNIYWLLIGASGNYFVGNFNQAGEFVPVQPALSLQHTSTSYAGQSFSGETDGRCIRLVWNRAFLPNSVFNCAMGTPVELDLVAQAEKILLRAWPVAELKNLHEDELVRQNILLPANSEAIFSLAGKAQDITLQLEGKGSVTVSLLGLEICLDLAAAKLCCQEMSMPLFSKQGQLDLRLISDTNAVEIYTGSGLATACIAHLADYNLSRLQLKTGASTCRIRRLSIARLRNIWQKDAP